MRGGDSETEEAIIEGAHSCWTMDYNVRAHMRILAWPPRIHLATITITRLHAPAVHTMTAHVKR